MANPDGEPNVVIGENSQLKYDYRLVVEAGRQWRLLH